MKQISVKFWIAFLNSAVCIFWTHSPPIVTRLYWSGKGESCGRQFVRPITGGLRPKEPPHWSKCLASGLFCRIFYQNIGNGHRHVPSNVRWLSQIKAKYLWPFLPAWSDPGTRRKNLEGAKTRHMLFRAGAGGWGARSHVGLRVNHVPKPAGQGWGKLGLSGRQVFTFQDLQTTRNHFGKW